jgi:hypothetical protein
MDQSQWPVSYNDQEAIFFHGIVQNEWFICNLLLLWILFNNDQEYRLGAWMEMIEL